MRFEAAAILIRARLSLTLPENQEDSAIAMTSIKPGTLAGLEVAADKRGRGSDNLLRMWLGTSDGPSGRWKTMVMPLSSKSLVIHLND
jgi:hypothetical protein